MKCRQCKVKFNKEDAVYKGAYYFCSKQHRLDFAREQIRKAKEKQKISQQKKKEKKADSISKLKKKLWDIISLYIRLRDSDDNNMCTCCTCGDKRHYKDSMQAGHYIPSGSSSFHRYNDKNIHAQCFGCNMRKGGNLIEYRPFMIKKYGLKYTEWLYETRNEETKLGKIQIKELTEQYQVKLNNIKENKCLD